MGELGEEEGEAAIERKRECTDLGKREEQVVCHASACALAMTYEAGRKAEMWLGGAQRGTWVGGAQRGSLWLCYAEPLAE